MTTAKTEARAGAIQFATTTTREEKRGIGTMMRDEANRGAITIETMAGKPGLTREGAATNVMMMMMLKRKTGADDDVFQFSHCDGMALLERTEGQWPHDLGVHLVDELDRLRHRVVPRLDLPCGVPRLLSLVQ